MRLLDIMSGIYIYKTFEPIAKLVWEVSLSAMGSGFYYLLDYSKYMFHKGSIHNVIKYQYKYCEIKYGVSIFSLHRNELC